MNGSTSIAGSILAVIGILGTVYTIFVKPQDNVNAQVQRELQRQDEQIIDNGKDTQKLLRNVAIICSGLKFNCEK